MGKEFRKKQISIGLRDDIWKEVDKQRKKHKMSFSEQLQRLVEKGLGIQY